MKTKRILSGLLCVLMLLSAVGVTTGADGEAPQHLFSLRDYSDNTVLQSLLKPAFNSGHHVQLTYDSENDVYLAYSDGTQGLNTVYLDVSGKIDVTQKHWLCGKTLEYEVDLRVLNHTNPLFELGVYSSGTQAGYTSFGNLNYGENIWWYPTQGICASNAYPVSNSVNSSLKVPCNEKTVGVSRRFRVTETEDGLFQFYHNGIDWKLLAFHAREDMLYTKGNPFIACRKTDTYGIRSLVIYPTPAQEQPIWNQDREIFSTKNHYEEALFLPGSNSSLQYDKATDTVEVTISGTALNMSQMMMTGNVLNMDTPHWLKNKTIEFEIVLSAIASANPCFEFSVYSYDKATVMAKSMNNGTNIWWYPTRGIIVDSTDNSTGNATGGVVTAPVRGKQGDSLRLRITENDLGMFFYYYDATTAEWMILQSYAAEKLPFVRGGMRFQGRGGDTYGIRGFRIYENAVDMEYVQTAKGTDQYDVRMIAALKDLNVERAGMMISATWGNGKTVKAKDYRISTVYTSLKASDRNGSITEVVAEEGIYFMPQAIHGIPIGEAGTVCFRVVPYVEKDGVRRHGIGYLITFDETGNFVSSVPEGGLQS